MFEVYAQDYRITIQEIPLGNQGEDMARCLVIDITDAVNEFGSGGTVSVRNKRNGDELPYFCTNVSTVTGADAEGNVHTYIKWTLTDVDTAAAGSGFVQADYIISGVTVKTWVYKYFILPSLGITGDVPDPYEDILEEIEAQVSAVQTAAASAAASAAQASAEATRIISTTQQVVEDWLSDHIVTGYTVDDTLTISGAAADSATVGTQLRAAFVTETTSGSIASFTDGADGVPVKDLVVNITPVQSGTGDPSPSNVRPISGWTAANIARTGKNFLDNTKTTTTVNGVTFTVNEDKSVTANGTATANAQLTLTLQSYIFGDVKFYGCSGGSPSTYNVYMWDSTVGARPKKWNGVDASGNAEGVFSEAKLIPGHINQLSLRVNVGATVNNVVFYPMICASTETNIEYEPYNGNAYNISFGDAGTVYGGTLDVLNGMLTVEYGLITFTTQTWIVASNNTYRYYNANIGSGRFDADPNVVSNWLPNAVGGSVAQFIQSGDVNNHNIYLYHADAIDASITDAASLKAYITSNPLQVVYKLQNPISIQLDPVSVASLLGNNNIWSDTGSVASCEYRADTKLYIEHLTDPDGDMVADANITSGSYFMVNNNLYLATANIANGGAITPGTNCTATNLAAALNAINS